jgi:phospholipase/carboxylesterase
MQQPQENAMTQNAHVIQQPPHPAAQLILLFHGVGADAQSMREPGERLAAEFPQAMVVSVAAYQPSDISNGFQWFSVIGITEENRTARVISAMPAFKACVAHWQQVAGVDATATALIGFSQGAIMALEATKQVEPLASRVFAISGRFATLPEVAPGDTTIHFLHGKTDTVMPFSHTVMAAHHLRDLGADITAEVLPFIGHEMHPDFVELVVSKITTHLPQKLWAAALKAGATPPT